MSELKLRYVLSQEARDAEFVRTGSRPESNQTITVESTDLDEPARAGWLAGRAVPGIPDGGSYILAGSEGWLLSAAAVRGTSPILRGTVVTADHYLSEEEARGYLRALPALVASCEPQLAAAAAAQLAEERRRAAVAAAQLADDQRRAAVAAAQLADDRRRQEQAQARAAARAAAKLSWIAAHGSAYLRTAHGAGYDCQRCYVAERAALELPGFALDWRDTASWRERSCPSEALLTEALALQAQGHAAGVVWLTSEVGTEPREPREAVVVTDYLGKYTLIH